MYVDLKINTFDSTLLLFNFYLIGRLENLQSNNALKAKFIITNTNISFGQMSQVSKLLCCVYPKRRFYYSIIWISLNLTTCNFLELVPWFNAAKLVCNVPFTNYMKL